MISNILIFDYPDVKGAIVMASRYYLAYDPLKQAILMSIKTDWFLELLGSEIAGELIRKYTIGGAKFQIGDNLGFAGIMQKTDEKDLNAPEVYDQYRLELPVMSKEAQNLRCRDYGNPGHGANCQYCRGTDHHFVTDHEMGHEFGCTLSVITQLINRQIGDQGQNLCGNCTDGLLEGMTPKAEQNFHFYFFYNPEVFDYLVVAQISPNAFNMLCASTFVLASRIECVEQSIIHARRHINSGVGRDPEKVYVRIIDGKLLIDIDGCCLRQREIFRESYSSKPFTFSSQGFAWADITFSLIAGLAELSQICERSAGMFISIKHR